jgi:cytochrome P450
MNSQLQHERDTGVGSFEYDPFSAEMHASPYAAYAYLREHLPLYYNPHRNLWFVSRYEGVQRIARDPKVFSNRYGVDTDGTDLTLLDRPGEDPGNLDNMDPPEHTAYHGVAHKSWTPKVVQSSYGETIRAYVDKILDALVAKEEGDLAQDLAWELPMHITAATLGLPEQDVPLFKEWTMRLTKRVPGHAGVPAEAIRTSEEVREYVRGHVERHAQQEREGTDFMARLCAHIGKEPITMVAAVGMANLFFHGQTGTSQVLLANALYLLGAYPEQRAWLADNPDALTSAIEEILRFESPVQHLFRTVLTDVEIHGQLIPAGARVVMLYGSAQSG